MIKGAIFDLDGTLLDSMFIWHRVDVDYLASHGKEPHENLAEKFKTMSMQQAARYFQMEYGITDSVDVIVNDIVKMIADFYMQEAKLKEGARKLVESFYAQQIPMCVATVNHKPMVVAALKRNGVLSYFKDVLTCEQFGCDKNSPLLYEKSCELLGTKPEDTYVFEDSLHAILTAKKAGFTVVGVQDESAKDDQTDIKNAADIYLVSLKDWR